MRRWSMVSVEEVRCVSTNSAAELTLTTSWVPATAKVMGISACCPTVIATFFTSAVAKPGALHADRVLSRRQQQNVVLAIGILAGGALQSLGLVPRRDAGVGHHSSLRVPDGDMQIAG